MKGTGYGKIKSCTSRELRRIGAHRLDDEFVRAAQELDEWVDGLDVHVLKRTIFALDATDRHSYMITLGLPDEDTDEAMAVISVVYRETVGGLALAYRVTGRFTDAPGFTHMMMPCDVDAVRRYLGEQLNKLRRDVSILERILEVNA